MEENIITIFCLVDDILKIMDIKDPKFKSEVQFKKN
jgi:hypothetical protein